MISQYELPRYVPDGNLPWSELLAGSPIVIDNGSFECRAGYASHPDPHLVFRNFSYRPRMSKSVLVGNDISEPDAVAHALKSPFMDGLLTGIDSQEHVLDHIFDRLSVQSHLVDHPILINEILCNPRVCRAQLMELLFEGYRSPHVAFYIDFLAAYYENCNRECSFGSQVSSSDCLLVSLGHQTSHIVPLMSTRDSASASFQPLFQAARRLHVGGAHISWIIQRLLHLKYSCHTERITFGLSEHLLHNFGKFALNYRDELELWRNPEYRQSQTKIIQLPLAQSVMNELNAAADRKRAQSCRMQDLHRRRHIEQLDSTRLKLNQLLMLDDVMGEQRHVDSRSFDDLPDVVKRGLKRFNLSSRIELQREIETCNSSIARLKHQIALVKPSGTSVSPTQSQLNTLPENMSSSSASAILQLVATTGTLKPMSELNDRQKRAADSLLSLALPAAVQAQMVATPVPGDSKLSDAKLRQRLHLAQELESGRGSDFLSWLVSIRHRRQKVAKRRTFRQSRVDLATEIGLHSIPAAQETPSSSVASRQPKGGFSTGVGAAAFSGLTKDDGASLKSQETSRNMSTEGDGRGSMTERRRIQLEKIRAMAAELKPTRGRGSKTSVCRPTPRLTRGGSATGVGRTDRSRGCRGRGRQAKPLPSVPASMPRKRLEFDQEEVDHFDDDLIDPWAPVFKEFDENDSNSATPSPWDADPDDSSNHPLSQLEAKKVPCLTPSMNIPGDPSMNGDTGDESENERDNIAVFDALLALYDPEVSKYLGTANLHISVREFYQIHVDTELLRASEVVFRPTFIGSSEAGIGETFEFVLRDTANLLDRESAGISDALWPRRVFLTGGLASLPCLAKRVFLELRPLLPFGTEYDNLEIIVADNPRLDAWHGARRWALNKDIGNIYISRKMYDEYGADRFVHHALSNQY
ncbi:unnamed protein product [Dicrocoelium dendriticum]|nr:unnamed protein product [Dicrocoelium dendriticum]